MLYLRASEEKMIAMSNAENSGLYIGDQPLLIGDFKMRNRYPFRAAHATGLVRNT